MLDQTRDSYGFLTGGGDAGALIRDFDWSKTPVGPIEGWPQSLRTAVSLVLNSEFPMYMVWGPELISFYNDAYRPILGSKPEALGRPFSEVWAETWSIVGPMARRALAGYPSYVESIPLTLERGGAPEETWWSFSYSPIRDESGGVGGVLCVVYENTGQVLAERALKEERDRLYALFEEAPGFVAALNGPEHVFALTNRSYRQLIGWREVVGVPVRQALPDVEGQGFFELLDRVYATGEPFVGRDVRVALQRAPEAPIEERFVDFIYQPIREHDGSISGIFVQGSDVTERVVFNAQQKLLLDELNHRVKNNLAAVQSIAAQTARHSPDLNTFQQTYEARLIALARTHDVLTASAWESADLRVLLEAELQIYGADRVRLDGPKVDLDAGQALAIGLVLHELATNAAKYGALSTPAGRVSVRWDEEIQDGAARLRLEWREENGPPVQPPSRRGFGSRLIERSVKGDMGGELRTEYRLDGFFCEITAPLQLEGRARPELRAARGW